MTDYMVTLGAQFGTAGRDAKPDSAGFYLECAGHIARCTYQPTHGFAGFGAKKKRVTYPSGAIRVPFEKLHHDAASLDAAKAWLVDMVKTDSTDPQCNRGPFYREGAAPVIKVHGHAGLVAINMDQRLYVIPCGSDGFSCWGFDVAEKKGRAVAAWLGKPELMPALPIPSPQHFDGYQATLQAGTEHNRNTGARCTIDLEPKLIPFEGKRVRVTERNGSTREFRVGKSTGWLPCHLEITRGEFSGPPAYIPEGATVALIRDYKHA